LVLPNLRNKRSTNLNVSKERDVYLIKQRYLSLADQMQE